jgi:RNA polymerase sigma factor (sigma-70 family)
MTQHPENFKAGDPQTWAAAFKCLYPVAFESARARLGGVLDSEIEDVAMETMADLVKANVQDVTESNMKAFVGAVARNKAVSRLRLYSTQRRGANKIDSLDAVQKPSESNCLIYDEHQFIDDLTNSDLRCLLLELSKDLKKEYRIVLHDHYLSELTHKEIAQKRNISFGSVGVFIQRGLESLRQVIARRPKLHNELQAILTDARLVQILLPLASAAQIGGWFLDSGMKIKFSLVEPGDRPPDEPIPRPPDEAVLRASDEYSYKLPRLSAHQSHQLFQMVHATHGKRYNEWLTNRRAKTALNASIQRARRIRRLILIGCIIVLIVYAAVSWIQRN